MVGFRRSNQNKASKFTVERGNLQVLYHLQHWICRTNLSPDSPISSPSIFAGQNKRRSQASMELKNYGLCIVVMFSDIFAANFPCLIWTQVLCHGRQDAREGTQQVPNRHIQQQYLPLPFDEHHASRHLSWHSYLLPLMSWHPDAYNGDQ